MLHSRSNNIKIKELQERCLWLVYNEKQSPYKGLLLKDYTVSIHYRNIQTLTIETFKVKKELSPTFLEKE